MDWGHTILGVVLFLALLKVGNQFIEIQKLHRGADLKNNRIDKLQTTIDRESELVVKLQEDYRDIQRALAEIVAERAERPEEDRVFLNTGDDLYSSISGVDEDDQDDEEDPPLEALIGEAPPKTENDSVRPIRFRRVKNGDA